MKPRAVLTNDEILESVIQTLNEALKADPEATNALMTHAVPCNQALADHPTIQVIDDSTPGGHPEVRALGLINGIVEPLCGKRLMAVYEGDSDRIAFFARYLGLDDPL